MLFNPDALRRTVEDKFGGLDIIVVGDLMLDVYLWGDVERVSPEAPVPILRLSRRTEAAGGAGNVALNLAGLGVRVFVVGLVGRDDAGRCLARLIGDHGVDCHPIAADDGRPTTVKTRVVGGHQHILRIDEETASSTSEPDQDRLLAVVMARLSTTQSAMILSDYHKGALTGRVCRSLIDCARHAGVPVLVDPKGRDFRKYSRATALTPNRHELELALGRGKLSDSDFRDASHQLRAELGLDFLVVTQGADGVTLFDESGDRNVSAAAREVFDVSGAGDTLIATLAAGLAAGLDREEALRLGNMAAGIVVGKVGTSPIHRDDLVRAILADPLAEQHRKVGDLASLERRVAAWRADGERVVFTNGCFDLLHAGHVTLLARARGEGDRLVVGLNTDRSVRVLKGGNRPVVAEADRARVLSGLACVDAVVLFDEETPFRLIEVIRPNVLVKGSDYEETQVVGADLVRSWGGTVVLIPLVEGQSTTRLLARMHPRAAER